MFKKLEIEIKEGIGKRLREVRESKRKTLTEMAVLYSKARGVNCVSHSLIQQYEVGSKPNPQPSAPYHYVLWISKEFKVDLHWLLYGE